MLARLNSGGYAGAHFVAVPPDTTVLDKGGAESLEIHKGNNGFNPTGSNPSDMEGEDAAQIYIITL